VKSAAAFRAIFRFGRVPGLSREVVSACHRYGRKHSVRRRGFRRDASGRCVLGVFLGRISAAS
jgi:hypothetical protein